MSDNNEVQGVDNTDYAEGYNQKAESLKYDKNLLEFNALCHKVFTSADGKKLMSAMYDRFVIPSLCHHTVPNFAKVLPFYEGVKEMVRTLNACTKAHEEYIVAEAKKGE